MRVLAFAAISADGFYSGPQESLDFIESRYWEKLDRYVLGIGNVIVGRRTFDLFHRLGLRDRWPDIHVTVLSHFAYKSRLSIRYTAAQPKKILRRLQEKGYEQTVVLGGKQTRENFQQSGLLTDIRIETMKAPVGAGLILQQ